jgi:hypothetical protein
MNLEFVDISLYKSIVIIGNHIWFRGNSMNSSALEGNERFSNFRVSVF